MSQRQTQQAPVRVPLELEALLKAAKGIGLLNLSQASTMRNNVATGQLSAGVVTADLEKKLRAAKLKWDKEKADARVWAKGRWARAIFDFQPTAEAGDARVPDLSFVKEDIIQLTLGEPMKWWRGTLASSPSREEGEFPSNYVELLEKQTATCDHHGESSGELDIFAGDVVVIVRRGEDRCYGFTERRAGEVKPFPVRCVQPVPQTQLATRAARDAKRATRAAELAHVTVDVSDDDDSAVPAETSSVASAQAQQAVDGHDEDTDHHNPTLEELKHVGQSRPPRAALGAGAKRFMDAGAAVVKRLREEEQAILAELEALDKVAEATAPTPPPVPVWPPNEKRRISRKCIGWTLLVTLVLILCVLDFMIQRFPGNDVISYRHEGIGDAHANGTDLMGWPRVSRNLRHVGSIWDPRKPCGRNATALMELGGSPDNYLTGMRRIITCDGDSVLVNFFQSFCAGLVFAALGLMCVAPDVRPSWCRCRSNRHGDEVRSSRCCVFTECVVVFLLGELLSFYHEFITAGFNSDPSTVDLWLVTLGLLIGLSLASLPICSCFVGYVCSCITTQRLKRAYITKQEQCEAQMREIKRLKAQVAATTARVRVEKYMTGQPRDLESAEQQVTKGQRQHEEQDDNKPEPADQSDDLSDAESELGYHIFRDESELLRIRFDASLPIGVDVFDGGVLVGVVPGSPAANAGVTLDYVVTAINDTSVARTTNAASILQLLSIRPVYVTFKQKDPAQLEVEPPPDQESAETVEF